MTNINSYDIYKNIKVIKIKNTAKEGIPVQTLMKEELQMRRVTKKWKTMLTGIAIGVMAL